MTNTSKSKGDRAEREVEALLRDLTGLPGVRRKLGAGRADDMGDIDGVPETCIQVANWANLANALREKVPACAEQQARMGALFGATFLRKRGGGYVVAMTPEQFAALWVAAYGGATVVCGEPHPETGAPCMLPPAHFDVTHQTAGAARFVGR